MVPGGRVGLTDGCAAPLVAPCVTAWQELDKQMEIMHKKIWEQRQKMGGVNASRENNQAIAKQIQILENRLDKALKRYNEALANNKRLRENIDNLRRERLVFDQIYRKLEKELAEKKKEMAR